MFRLSIFLIITVNSISSFSQDINSEISDIFDKAVDDIAFTDINHDFLKYKNDHVKNALLEIRSKTDDDLKKSLAKKFYVQADTIDTVIDDHSIKFVEYFFNSSDVRDHFISYRALSFSKNLNLNANIIIALLEQSLYNLHASRCLLKVVKNDEINNLPYIIQEIEKSNMDDLTFLHKCTLKAILAVAGKTDSLDYLHHRLLVIEDYNTMSHLLDIIGIIGEKSSISHLKELMNSQENTEKFGPPFGSDYSVMPIELKAANIIYFIHLNINYSTEQDLTRNLENLKTVNEIKKMIENSY